jgi:hypothetical protein
LSTGRADGDVLWAAGTLDRICNEQNGDRGGVLE